MYFASKEKGWLIEGKSQQKSRYNGRGEHSDSVHGYNWILSFFSASTFRIELWNRENQESLKCLNNADKSDQFSLNSSGYFMKSFCQNLLWTLYYTWENFRRIIEIYSTAYIQNCPDKRFRNPESIVSVFSQSPHFF